jgi:hypothetical protein
MKLRSSRRKRVAVVYRRTHLDEKAHKESMEGLPSGYCRSSLDDLVESESTGMVSKHGARLISLPMPLRQFTEIRQEPEFRGKRSLQESYIGINF